MDICDVCTCWRAVDCSHRGLTTLTGYRLNQGSVWGGVASAKREINLKGNTFDTEDLHSFLPNDRIVDGVTYDIDATENVAMCSEGAADTYYPDNVHVVTDVGCATTVVDGMTTPGAEDITSYYTKLIAGAVITLVLVMLLIVVGICIRYYTFFPILNHILNLSIGQNMLNRVLSKRISSGRLSE